MDEYSHVFHLPQQKLHQDEKKNNQYNELLTDNQQHS